MRFEFCRSPSSFQRYLQSASYYWTPRRMSIKWLNRASCNSATWRFRNFIRHSIMQDPTAVRSSNRSLIKSILELPVSWNRKFPASSLHSILAARNKYRWFTKSGTRFRNQKTANFSRFSRIWRGQKLGQATRRKPTIAIKAGYVQSSCQKHWNFLASGVFLNISGLGQGRGGVYMRLKKVGPATNWKIKTSLWDTFDVSVNGRF